MIKGTCMFGMGFTEILIIAVIAIMFLGPEKLPDALVQIAKFFKSFKSSVNEVKESISHEMQLQQLKDEAQEYQKKLNKSLKEIETSIDKNSDINDITNVLDDTTGSVNKEIKKIENDVKKKDSDA